MSEQKFQKLSPERLEQIQAIYDSPEWATWRAKYREEMTDITAAYLCDLLEAYHAQEQELAAANSVLSIFDCAGCNHPYKRHIGSFMRCDDCFCDGYVAHREITASRAAIARLEKQVVVADNQFRLAKKLLLSVLKRNEGLKQELEVARARIAELENAYSEYDTLCKCGHIGYYHGTTMQACSFDGCQCFKFVSFRTTTPLAQPQGD